jgi:hypothetical protein
MTQSRSHANFTSLSYSGCRITEAVLDGSDDIRVDSLQPDHWDCLVLPEDMRTPEFESELPAYYGLWSEAKNENGTTLFVFSPKPLEGRYASH